MAVLPFENRSREADDAYFVDGIHDDILTQLSKVSALRVISRTSVERFRESKLSLQQIAQQLGVRSILEGGVQRAGDRVRINVQLIDATTDAHMWAETYDRELVAANIFAIQSELAAAIADALKASLTPSEQARAKRVPTQNLEAWEAYQLGRQRMAKRTSAALTDAEQFFRKATNLDPKFALAWTGLADTFYLQTLYAGRSPDAGLRDAEQAATKALELDPNLAEAWTSAAGIASERQQFDRSEEMFRRAIELNPNYALAHHWLSALLFQLGRWDEALQEARRVVVLDPLSAVANEQLGTAQEQLGRYQEAEASYRKTLTIDPLRPNGYWSLSFLNAYALNRFSVAVPLMEKAVELDPEGPHGFPYLWGTTGLGYNPDMVEKVLGTRTLDSLSAVFDPTIASKLASCGITWLDAPETMFELAFIYLGVDANSQRPEDQAAAEALLTRVRPYVRYFHSSQYVNDLASGEVCVAISWTNGAMEARLRGADAEAPVEIVYTIPKEGAPFWFDMIAIPIDAPHPDNAHAFLDYIMEPKVIAAITNKVGQPNSNAASIPFVIETLLNDPAVYPTKDVFSRLALEASWSPETSRSITRAWTRIRTGE